MAGGEVLDPGVVSTASGLQLEEGSEGGERAARVGQGGGGSGALRPRVPTAALHGGSRVRLGKQRREGPGEREVGEVGAACSGCCVAQGGASRRHRRLSTASGWRRLATEVLGSAGKKRQEEDGLGRGQVGWGELVGPV